jgi:hypothetical protein
VFYLCQLWSDELATTSYEEALDKAALMKRVHYKRMAEYVMRRAVNGMLLAPQTVDTGYAFLDVLASVRAEVNWWRNRAFWDFPGPAHSVTEFEAVDNIRVATGGRRDKRAWQLEDGRIVLSERSPDTEVQVSEMLENALSAEESKPVKRQSDVHRQTLRELLAQRGETLYFYEDEEPGKPSSIVVEIGRHRYKELDFIDQPC